MTTHCFVIGPIGNRLAPVGSPEREVYEEAIEVLERVIVPACEKFDIQAIRADQIAASGEISDQVFKHLRDDEVVVADLSGANANVMYELGVRHTTGKLTIQLGEFGQLPFDVRAIRTIQFSRSERGLVDARKELERSLKIGLAEGGDPVTVARLWTNRDEPVGHVPEESEVQDEPGFLEQVAVLEESFPRLTDITERIVGSINDFGPITERAAAEMDKLNDRGAPASARIRVFGQFADELTVPATELSEATKDFNAELESVDGGLRGVVEFLRANPELAPQAEPLVEGIEAIVIGAREGMEGLNSLSGAADGLASVSRRLREPAQLISNAVKTMGKSISLIDDWERLMQPLHVAVDEEVADS